MKILVVNWRDIKNPEAGGAEIHIDEILKRKPENVEVDFVAANFKNSQKEEMINNYRVIRIPNNFLFNFTFPIYYKLFLKKNNYDAIIDCVSKIPVVIHKYEKKKPILAIHYHIHGKSLFKELFYPVALYVYLMEKYLLKAYKNVPLIAISESNKSALLQEYQFNKIYLSYVGINYNYYYNEIDYDQRKKQILYFGRLKKYKRVDHIIYAFDKINKKNKEIKLVIAGKGDDEERLKNIVNELNINDYVEFKGFITEEEKAKLIAESLVYVIASEKEGWGISVIEANAGGLPSIGYKVEGLVDSIKDCYSGYLVENGNIEKLSEKILSVLNNKEEWQKLSENAKKWAYNFSWDKTAEDFYNILNETIENFNKK